MREGVVAARRGGEAVGRLVNYLGSDCQSQRYFVEAIEVSGHTLDMSW